MEDIEVQIVFDYCHKNKEFREKAGLVKLFVKNGSLKISFQI